MAERLPEGWARTILGEILAPSRARALPSEALGLPYVGLEHVEAHTMKLLGQDESGERSSSSVRFHRDDVLYGKMRPYSPGVKANVLFFDKRPKSKKPATRELWVYDLRTNRNFTLRQSPITDADLREFVDLYDAEDRKGGRRESERFKRFTYVELMNRDRANLDIFWLRDDSLAGVHKLARPEELASAILRDLEDAMKAFSEVEQELKR